MSKKSNSNLLTYVFIALAVIVGVIYLTDLGKNDKSFKTVIVDVDTSEVTSVVIFPKSQTGKQIKLYREDSNWFVEFDSGKTDNAPKSKIKNLFNQILKIKPKRVAARSEDKWSQYEVDDKATRVKVFEDGDLTLDLIVGKVSFQQPRTMNTYVRIADEKDVYVVDGFLSMTFNQGADSWRDGTILKGNLEKWNLVSVDFPGDSSYEFHKVKNRWLPLGVKADSAKTIQSLRKLTTLSGSKYLDDISVDTLGAPKYKLTVETETDTVVVKGFEKGNIFAIESSQNPGTLFDGNNGKLRNRVFLSPREFSKKK